MTMKLESSALAEGAKIDRRFTGDGEDVSPPLAWHDPPAGTRQFALVCDDPDAPSPQPWVHWLIYGIAADVERLPENLPAEPRLTGPVAALQGHNSWTTGRVIGYRGPQPPRGKPHHYHFRLYALDAPLDVPPGLDRAALEKAMAGHILARAELVGVYSR
ncbi:MAG TPA: YbhB/YbcL family Raf kinase inhibitor-like protein [Pirellulales bacterium]|jgi:hypothetical protein